MAIGNPVNLGTGTASGAGATTITISTLAAISAGDLITVWVTMGGSSLSTVSSITVGTNTLIKADSVSSGGTGIELWYKENASSVASTTNLTVTFSALVGGGPGAEAGASTTSGVLTASSLDLTPAGFAGTTNSPSISTGTLSQANEIVFGVVYHAAGTYMTSAGFADINSVLNNVGDFDYFSYEIVASTASVTYNPSFSTSTITLAVVATFKGIGAAVVVPTGWYMPWVPPRFSQLSMDKTKTEAWPPEPPFVLQGMAWHKTWEPPRFGPVKDELHKTEMFLFVQSAVFGIAWQRPWEPPYFSTAVKAEKHKTEMWPPEPPFVLQGMPWYRPWEQPYFYPVKVEKHQTELRTSVPYNLISSIQGMAWFNRFEEPLRPTYFPFEMPPSMTPMLLIYLAGSGIPLLYQASVGSLAQSGFWKGRGIQK